MNLSLYLVTDTLMCGQFGVAATVSTAVRAGVTMVQLRDARASDDDLVSLGRKILTVLEGTDVPLIVNDRVHLVEAMGAHGGHVGQSDLGIGAARTLLGPAAYLGLSVQTTEHVAAAREHGKEMLDYLGVGPVWGTATKLDAAAPGASNDCNRSRRRAPGPAWPSAASP
jgi:thiamine-phosphate pyrophosphorylase